MTSLFDKRREDIIARAIRAEDGPDRPAFEPPKKPNPCLPTDAYDGLTDDLRGVLIDAVPIETWVAGGLEHAAVKVAAVLRVKGDELVVLQGLRKMGAEGTLVEWLTKGFGVKS